MKVWKYIAFFVFCLIISLAVNLPIRQVMPYLNLPKTVRVSGVDGTAFVGQAAEVQLDGFPLRDIEYRFQPSCIPLLKICYRIDYAQGELNTAYDLLNGDTELSDVRIRYPVTDLAKQVPNLLVQPVGQLELSLDNLALVAGKPAALNGNIVWRDLGIIDRDARVIVGDFKMDFTGNGQSYDFKISDLAGNLDVDGEGQIDARGQYRVDLKIVGKDNVEPQIRSVLDLVGKKVGQDHYRIEQTGRLPQRVVARLLP